MKSWLIDTGPFVAYFDRTDALHDSVAACLDAFPGQLSTTTAVVTEVMYFLADVANGPVSFAELLLASGIRLVEISEPQQVIAAVELMVKYSDTPMDFADATLVLAAEELGVTEILTLDRRGFSTFRTRGGKAFRQVLK